MKDVVCQVLESTHLMLNNPGACMLSRFSHIQLCDPHGLEPGQAPWNSTGKNTGVGHHGLILGIILTQGSS